MLCQCRLTNCNYCTTLVRDIGNWACMMVKGMWEISIPSSQFCCNPKTPLKNNNKVFFLKREKESVRQDAQGWKIGQLRPGEQLYKLKHKRLLKSCTKLNLLPHQCIQIMWCCCHIILICINLSYCTPNGQWENAILKIHTLNYKHKWKILEAQKVCTVLVFQFCTLFHYFLLN